MSKRFSPAEIQREVDSFLAAEIKRLHDEVTEDDIHQLTASIIKSLQDPPKTYTEEASEFWGSIMNDIPFDWVERVMDELRRVKKSDLLTLVRESVEIARDDGKESQRRSLEVMIYGGKTSSEVYERDVRRLSQLDKTTVITSLSDATHWKDNLSYTRKSDFTFDVYYSN